LELPQQKIKGTHKKALDKRGKKGEERKRRKKQGKNRYAKSALT
jgi:hypothetical protein